MPLQHCDAHKRAEVCGRELELHALVAAQRVCGVGVRVSVAPRAGHELDADLFVTIGYP